MLNQKYQNGEFVFALEAPEVKLIIKRYLDRIYFCENKDQPGSKLMAYFERELSPGNLV